MIGAPSGRLLLVTCVGGSRRSLVPSVSCSSWGRRLTAEKESPVALRLISAGCPGEQLYPQIIDRTRLFVCLFPALFFFEAWRTVLSRGGVQSPPPPALPPNSDANSLRLFLKSLVTDVGSQSIVYASLVTCIWVSCWGDLCSPKVNGCASCPPRSVEFAVGLARFPLSCRNFY